MQSVGFLMFLPMLLYPMQELPQDALAAIQPQYVLEILGKDASGDLGALITSGLAADDDAVSAVTITKDLERAIQNLRSRNDAVREKSRETLVAQGAGILAKMKDVAANDARRADEAKLVIAAIEAGKSAAKHEVYLAQEAAIRLAAMEKKTALVPAIRKALGTPNPFVKLAAQDALARLDKTAESTTFVKQVASYAELEALPVKTKALLSVRMQLPELGAKDPVTMQSYVEKISAVVGDSLSPEDLQMGRTTVVDFVRTYGNFRPERAFVFNVGTASQTGGLGIIVQGVYQPEVLGPALEESPLWTSTEIAGYKLYNSPFARLVMLSDSSVLVLPVMVSAKFPIKKYLGDLAAKRQVLALDKDFGPFIKALRDEIQVRAFVNADEEFMAEIYSELQGAPDEIADIVRSTRTLNFTVTKLENGNQRVRIEVQFSKEKSATAAVEMTKQGVAAALVQLESVVAEFPPAEKFVALFKAIKVTAEGKKGILRFEAPKLGMAEFMGIFMGRSMQVR